MDSLNYVFRVYISRMYIFYYLISLEILNRFTWLNIVSVWLLLEAEMFLDKQNETYATKMKHGGGATLLYFMKNLFFFF